MLTIMVVVSAVILAACAGLAAVGVWATWCWYRQGNRRGLARGSDLVAAIAVSVGLVAWVALVGGMFFINDGWAADDRSGAIDGSGGTSGSGGNVILDGSALGGYCGCLNPGNPGYGTDPAGLATSHDVNEQGDPNGTCGCTP